MGRMAREMLGSEKLALGSRLSVIRVADLEPRPWMDVDVDTPCDGM